MQITWLWLMRQCVHNNHAYTRAYIYKLCGSVLIIIISYHVYIMYLLYYWWVSWAWFAWTCWWSLKKENESILRLRLLELDFLSLFRFGPWRVMPFIDTGMDRSEQSQVTSCLSLRMVWVGQVIGHDCWPVIGNRSCWRDMSGDLTPVIRRDWQGQYCEVL